MVRLTATILNTSVRKLDVHTFSNIAFSRKKHTLLPMRDFCLNRHINLTLRKGSPRSRFRIIGNVNELHYDSAEHDFVALAHQVQQRYKIYRLTPTERSVAAGCALDFSWSADANKKNKVSNLPPCNPIKYPNISN